VKRKQVFITGITLVLALLILPLPAIWAEEAAELADQFPGEERPETVSEAQTGLINGELLIDFGMDWIGINLGIGYALELIEGRRTITWVYSSLVYQTYGYFRTPDGRIYNGDAGRHGGTPAMDSDPGYDPAAAPYYTGVGAMPQFGMEQELLKRGSPDSIPHSLNIFGFHRLFYEQRLPNGGYMFFDDIDLAEEEWQLHYSFLLGLSWSSVNRSHPHRLLKGLYAEASFEWGPRIEAYPFLGRSDYFRLNASAAVYFPLFDLQPERELNILSGYLALYAAADWAFGGYIPLDILRSIGGRNPRIGLGNTIRGYELGRFDAPVKTAASAELRINLPALGLNEILPGLIVHLDGGFYHYPDENVSGFISSFGAGAYLSLFDFVQLTFYTHGLLFDRLVTGGAWVPLSFEFVFHF
jgi:hypothetical protein